MVVSGLREGGSFFSGYRISVWKNEIFLEIDDGDG
jgi:hypothetical protein